VTGRPAGYRSCKTSMSSFFIVAKEVRGSAKRRTVCLPCLKRRVQAVALTSSAAWVERVSRFQAAGSKIEAYHILGL
jgi:hypothetical protein